MLVVSSSSGGSGGTGSGPGVGSGHIVSENAPAITSLSYFSSTTVGGAYSLSGTVKMKNIGSDNLKIRADMISSDQVVNVILDAGENKMYSQLMSQGPSWTESEYSPDLATSYMGVISQISAWSGSGDYTYTDEATGDNVTLSYIEVNPSIPDSVFQPT